MKKEREEKNYFKMTDAEISAAKEYTAYYKSDSIEIIENENPGQPHCLLFFKGTNIPARFYFAKEFEFSEIMLQAKDFLNIDATEFPEKVEFRLDQPIESEMASRFCLQIKKTKNRINIQFSFYIHEPEDFLTMNINPVKHLYSFLKLAKEEGYETKMAEEYSPDNLWGDVITGFTAEGNIFEKYEKHFLIIKHLYEKAALDMGFKEISLLDSN